MKRRVLNKSVSNVIPLMITACFSFSEMEVVINKKMKTIQIIEFIRANILYQRHLNFIFGSFSFKRILLTINCLQLSGIQNTLPDKHCRVFRDAQDLLIEKYISTGRFPPVLMYKLRFIFFRFKEDHCEE